MVGQKLLEPHDDLVADLDLRLEVVLVKLADKLTGSARTAA